MNNIFFTGDTHFNHEKCCSLFRKGKFSSVEEMNEVLISKWNARVKKGDRVYHLGDFALGRIDDAEVIAKRLNGDIFLLRGNHEAIAEHPKVRDRFIWIKDYFGLRVGDQKIQLFHYPMVTWNCSHYGSWHLHAHCHGNLKDDPNLKRLDTGVDCTSFEPISYDEVKKIMDAKKLWASSNMISFDDE